MTEAATSASAVPFELKGSLFTLTVMHLRSPDLDAIERELARKTNQAPEFFRNAPVVLDLAGFDASNAPDFRAIKSILRDSGLIPVGVRHGESAVREAAIATGLAILPERIERDAAKPKPAANSAAKEVKDAPVAARRAERGGVTRVVTQPVRSGQQIYAEGCDLLALRTVSAGAEIVSDGNIHVLGQLRGRALAGASGDEKSHIICQSLEAELVSIAGRYRVFDELDPDVRGKAVHIHLDGDRLLIEPI